PARLYVTHSPTQLFVTTCVHDPHRKINLGQAKPVKPDPAALLNGHHIRILLTSSNSNLSFVVAPQGGQALTKNQKAESAARGWSGVSRREGDFWVVEFTIPLELLKAHEELRFNAVHFDP